LLPSKRILASSILALTLFAGAATATAQEEGTPRKPVVFNVGDAAGID